MEKGHKRAGYGLDMRKNDFIASGFAQLEKYLNLEGFLEKSLKIKFALKNTRKSLKGLEKSLNSSIFYRTFLQPC